MKTGLLVHGCNLKVENWRHVAWGDPPGLLGRIPQGVLTALRFDAELIVFGTGASKKRFQFGDQEDRQNEELLEAEYSLEYLKVHFDELQHFQPIRSWMDANEVSSPSEFSDRILGRLQLDIRSKNTFEEIENAAKIFLEHDIDQIVLVSSPTHVVRCLRDATAIFKPQTLLGRFCNCVFANPSVTCYEGTTGKDVVVIEPPHRPDRHVVPTHRRIQRMMELQKLTHDDLVKFIDEFDDLLQQYENRFHTLGIKS